MTKLVRYQLDKPLLEAKYEVFGYYNWIAKKVIKEYKPVFDKLAKT